MKLEEKTRQEKTRQVKKMLQFTSSSQSHSAAVSSPPPVPQCWPVSGGSGGSEPAAGTSTSGEEINDKVLSVAYVIFILNYWR